MNMMESLSLFNQHFASAESTLSCTKSTFRTEIRNWKFKVSANTVPGEVVCVTGDCEQLGCWRNDNALVLTKEKNYDDVWNGIGAIPLADVQYRFFVGILIEPDGLRHSSKKIIVRRWETNVLPRIISSKSCTNVNDNVEPEIFGTYNGNTLIEKGWLTSETVVQFKLYENPIHFWKKKLQSKKIYVKVTPVNLNRGGSVDLDKSQSDALNQDEGLSLETMDLNDNINYWPITEIAVLNETERCFKPQGQFGQMYCENDFLVFQIFTHSPENVAYLIDFYAYGEKIIENDPPDHLGFSYILPSNMVKNEGQAIIPITSVRHHPIGQISVSYLVVHPLKEYNCDMSLAFSKQWKTTWSGLVVGHRGSGTSFHVDTKYCAEVRENTIASLKAAAANGADMVEFDVQLSKDLIPVIYHDYFVNISIKQKKSFNESKMFKLPVKELSHEQLQSLKIYHLKESDTDVPRFRNNDAEEHQPFPTLQQALEVIDPNVGFNIELKWTMQLADGSFELDNPIDINIFLDKIIEVVLKYSGSRIIIFSCFNPEVCTMLRLKQNKYAVVFLTQCVTAKYPPYADPRSLSVQMGVDFALSAGILGINLHAEEILRKNDVISYIKNSGLILFSWGDDNNEPENIKHQKKLGVNAIIYDMLDQRCPVDSEKSIFLMEATESQKKLLLRAVSQQNLEAPTSVSNSLFQENLDIMKIGKKEDNSRTNLS